MFVGRQEAGPRSFVAKAVLQATQVFLTKDKRRRMPRRARGRGRRSSGLSRGRRRSVLRLVGAAANAAQFERDAFPSARGRSALAEAAPAVARRHASDVVTNVIPVAVGLSPDAGRDLSEEWAAQPCSSVGPSRLRRRGSEHVGEGDQALRRLAATLGKKVAPKLLVPPGPRSRPSGGKIDELRWLLSTL